MAIIIAAKQQSVYQKAATPNRDVRIISYSGVK